MIPEIPSPFEASLVRPLRILHMAATADGAPWMVAIMREQRRRGHDVMAVINGRDGQLGPIFEREGFAYEVTNLDLTSGLGLRATATKFRRATQLLLRLKPDVVQSHLFPSIILGRLACWVVDAPLRYSMIPGTFFLEAPILEDMDAGTAWADTKVIATCEQTRTLYVEHGIARDHVELVYYGLDQEGWDPSRADGRRVRRELGLTDAQPVIGLVAYFYPPVRSTYLSPPHLIGRGVKGHEILLQAIPRVRQEFPDARFVLVGKGWGTAGEEYRREIVQLAEQLGVDGAVLFTGERHDIPDTLAALDISLQISLCENLGGSIESLMMARPLIATKVGGLVDSVLHEKTGLLVPPSDPEAVADAILRLLREPALGRRLGAEGRRFMLERFTLRRAVDDLEALYARAILDEKLGEGAPSTQRYRRRVRFLRLIAFPFRVAPIIIKVQTIRFSHVTVAGVLAQLTRRLRHQVIPRLIPPIRTWWRAIRR